MSKQSKILIISGVITVFLLAGGGIFWANKKDFSQPTNSPNSYNPSQKSNNDKPNNPPEQKNPPPADNPSPSDNPQENNNKTKLKIFWVGSLWFNEKYEEDYWAFCEGEEWSKPGKQRFLIAKSNPVLAGKLLDQDLSFILSYDENQVVKEIIEKGGPGSDNKPLLTLFKSGFTLTPNAPLKDDPDFLNRFNNTKSKEIYFDYSKYSGGDYVFVDSQIQAGQDEKDCDKFVFHSDNPSIQELLAKNHLQNQSRRSEKEFRVFYMERDVEKRIFLGNSCTYYLNNQAQVKTVTFR